MDTSVETGLKHSLERPAKRPSRAEAEDAVRTLIAWAGDDPNREGLRDTPARVVAASEEFFSGYGQKVAGILSSTFENTANYKEIVLVRDIPFVSHCEHHMLPFLGKAHVGYVPTGPVVGLSKLARVVDAYARRLQTQERLTASVAAAIDRYLKPHGVAVLIAAEHQCISLRGASKPGSSTVTTHFTGLFDGDNGQQTRFLNLVWANNGI